MKNHKVIKKSFLLYCDQINVIDKLTDTQAGFLIKKVYGYCGNGHVPPEIKDPLVDVVFTSIRTVIDRDYDKYLKIVERNRKNGEKGGRPKEEPKKPSGLSGNPNNPDEPK